VLQEAFPTEVLTAFVGQFDFSKHSIDGALRTFLHSFRLPGEAQKIDRLMEAFAKALFAANPGRRRAHILIT
jgi:Sec7-like guanine-nucleotide exchange factor